MILIYCPHCKEKRPEIEFAYAGEAHFARPDAAAQNEMSDAEWSEFLFVRSNVRGEHFERWWHANGCNMFFNAVRNTVTDKFIKTYKIGTKRPSAAQLKKWRSEQGGRK